MSLFRLYSGVRFTRLQSIFPILSRAYTVETKIAMIDKAVKENDLVVFMKGDPDSPMCGFSRAVCQILELNGIGSFKHFNVLEDDEIRQGIKQYTKWPTIPQVFVKGEFIGGCDILMSMHQSGELKALLEKNKLVNKKNAR